jgi:hypothetical protein
MPSIWIGITFAIKRRKLEQFPFPAPPNPDYFPDPSTAQAVLSVLGSSLLNPL